MPAMRDRDRANKSEIEIFVFSVTSNDFPHDMLLLTFSSKSRLKAMVPTLSQRLDPKPYRSKMCQDNTLGGQT
jgi:hypothetical protein